MSADGSQEVGVRQHHSADGRRVLSAPGMAELRPGALEDGGEVDEILAEEEGASDDENGQHGDHPSDAEPQHVFVIRRFGCREVAHWWCWTCP